MAVINVNMFSMYLRYGVDCTVVLPDKLEKDEKLKCVWLYHGSSGDHTAWLYNTPLVQYVKDRHFAAVLPNVNESCFVDMNIGDKYGKFVGRELPSAIWNMFKCISDKREDNYIAGFSNGGYGCLHTALIYSDKFSKVGAFSAGDKADADFPNDGGAKSVNRIRLFGDGDIHNSNYSVLHLADELLKKYKEKQILQNNILNESIILKDISDSDEYVVNKSASDNKLKRDKNIYLPQIYHACGGLDPWLDMNHIVRDYFMKYQQEFNYQYDEMAEYGHEWPFWKAELEKFLNIAL